MRFLTFVSNLFEILLAELDDIAYRISFPGNPGRLNRRSRRDVWLTIKRLRALQRKGVYVYGATNRIRAKGSPLSCPITQGGATAGSAAVVGTGVTALAGVVESAKDANNNAVVHYEGVWSLSFTSVGAIAVGDPIYIIPGTAVLTQTAASNRLFGNALNTQSGSTTAALSIRLAGSN